ncbi:MAG: DegV family protein [Clostridiales bacterium]|nr:DegV family protein [Clostridiales bacterium]
MASKVILSADSTCDLSAELKERYSVNYFPLHIILDGKDYLDNVDIKPSDIFNAYYEKKILPKTAAVNIDEYSQHFKQFVDKGYEVVHINLGSALSSSYKNACIAAEDFKGVYAVDSCNLSTGIGHLVIQAGKMINQGLSGAEIATRLNAMTSHVHSSFVLDTLKFMAAGGRCSSVAALGANLLNLKPCILVSNKDGSMSSGKKYRGKLEKILPIYVEETLGKYDNIDYETIFITHSGIDQSYIDLVKKTIIKIHPFKEYHETIASCTISSHCGPNTLGILFMTK